MDSIAKSRKPKPSSDRRVKLRAELEVLTEQAAAAARMLKLLGNEYRLLILCFLAAHGEMKVGDLVDAVGLSQSALSQHLALLREDGLVAYRREFADAVLSCCRSARSADSQIAQRYLLRRSCLMAASRFAAVVILALCALPAMAETDEPYPPLLQPLIVEQVPGAPIYYTIGSPGIPEQKNQGHTSNAGFVVTTDGVVVFDALGTPSLGWNLLEAIKRITSAPVRYNIVSHYHADHIYGLQAFKDHSAEHRRRAAAGDGIPRGRRDCRRACRATARPAAPRARAMGRRQHPRRAARYHFR